MGLGAVRERKTLCAPWVWRVLKTLDRVGILKLINLTVAVEQVGLRLKIPIRKGVGLEWLWNGESWADPIYPALLAHFPGSFVDVGVNLGQSLARLRAYDRERDYLGFEPNPACVEYTRRFLNLNKLEQEKIITAALADADGAAQLLLTRDDPTDPGATIVDGFKGAAGIASSVPVAKISFRTVEADHRVGKIGMIKVDVEGAEREVLIAMEHRLRSDRPSILIEILPTGIPAMEERLHRQQDIEAFLDRTGYALLQIHNKAQDSKVELMTRPIGVHADQEISNFIGVPKERLAELQPLLERMYQQ